MQEIRGSRPARKRASGDPLHIHVYINRIQNKSICLHNIWVYCVYLLCIYKYTHMQYTFWKYFCHESRALHFLYSPPEFPITRTPHTCQSPHTLPAVLHHHGLFIHLTPAPLPACIVYVCVSHCVFTRWGDMHCVPVVYLFCFFALLGFLFIKIYAYLHLNPDLCFSSVPLARTVTNMYIFILILYINILNIWT